MGKHNDVSSNLTPASHTKLIKAISYKIDISEYHNTTQSVKIE